MLYAFSTSGRKTNSKPVIRAKGHIRPGLPCAPALGGYRLSFKPNHHHQSFAVPVCERSSVLGSLTVHVLSRRGWEESRDPHLGIQPTFPASFMQVYTNRMGPPGPWDGEGLKYTSWEGREGTGLHLHSCVEAVVLAGYRLGVTHAR